MVIEVRTPPSDEYELAPVSVGILAAGASQTVLNTRNANDPALRGMRVTNVSVLNSAAADVPTVSDETGESIPVRPGIPTDWDRSRQKEGGCQFVRVTAGAVGVAAGEVVVILTVAPARAPEDIGR